MSGNGEVDQCPFCNAQWGDCSHVKLLVELEGEIPAQPKPTPPACAASRDAPAAAGEKSSIVGGAIRRTDRNKTVFSSW